MTATQSTLITVEELEAMGEAAEHIELIEGGAREMPPSGGRHGDIQSELHLELGHFVRTNGLGRTFVSDTGFVISRNPDSVLAPDLAFVAKDLLPDDEEAPVGFIPFAPDLAVEIASPSNSESELLLKTALYLAGGTKLVWLIRPRQQTVTIFSSDAPERILRVDDVLDGGGVVPGFSLPLAGIFRRS